MTRRSWSLAISQLGRVGLLGGAALALVASSQEGDRAFDGECPAGETCAQETPSGLLFEGAPLGFWPALTAHTIAAGGQQTFRITDNATESAFALPFTATVTGAGHEVVAVGVDRVTVGASTTATGHLRIVAPAGELYDRVAIDSAEVGSMRLAPTHGLAYPRINPARWATYAGGTAQVSVVLTAADGRWLVDEDLAIRAAATFQRIGWDSIAVATPVVGPVTLAVDAGNVVDRRLSFAVVDGFDDVDVLAPVTTGVGGDIAVCFVAWQRGGGDSDDTLVVGVPWQLQISGPATPLESQRYASCVELHTDAAGTVVVTAAMGGQTWGATIQVASSSANQKSRLRDWLWSPTEGERAALVAD